AAGIFTSVPSGAVPAPAPNPAAGTTYVGFRLSDFSLTAASGSARPQLWVQIGAKNTSTNVANPFTATLEYYAGKDASNNDVWIPYNRFIGINSPATWANSVALRVREANARDGVPTAANDPFVSPDAPASNNKPIPYCLLKSDPRSTRFGAFQIDTNSS